MTSGDSTSPLVILAQHVARLLQHDPTSTALRELEARLASGQQANDAEAVRRLVHEIDLLAARSARWSHRLRQAQQRVQQ